MMPYGSHEGEFLYVKFFGDLIRVYDANLKPVAETNNTSLTAYIDKISLADYDDTVYVFVDGVYSRHLKKLLTFKFTFSAMDPILRFSA